MNLGLDLNIALVVLAAVVFIFTAALLVPRRSRPTMIPQTEVRLDEIVRRMEGLEQKQAQNDHDVRGIRMVIQAMPTEKTVQEIRAQVAAVTVQVAAVTGKVDGMHDTLITNGHSLKRIEDYLIGVAIENISGKGAKPS